MTDSSTNTPPPEDDRTRVVSRPAQPTGGDTGATVITAGTTSLSGAPVTSPATGTGSHDAGLLPVGSRLAEFEITRVIGQGGFGVVYEAWDHTLERVVAIKEYLPTSLSTRQQDGTVVPLSERHRETFDLGMRSFINEARLLAQFDHPSLLKVYRFWQERGTTYMVMPFYRGDTLREALAAIPAGVDEAWLIRIMDGITQALAVMHSANCYHLAPKSQDGEMLKWVLILAINGHHELVTAYQSESECEKAAAVVVEASKIRKEPVLAGCYEKISVTSWSGN